MELCNPTVRRRPMDLAELFQFTNLLRGSGYLGYVDSNQGFVVTPISGSKMFPNPRVINIHITSYIQYPEPLSKVGRNGVI